MRYVWLDAIRWVLASGVFFYHSFEGRLPDSPTWDVITRVGGHGIIPFFVISGFAITLTLPRATPTSFVKNRLKRLLPSLIFVGVLQVILTVYVERGNFNFETVARILRDAGQGLIPYPNADGSFANFVAWTIAVEVRFYALAFLLLLVLQILKKHVSDEYIYYGIGTWLGLLYLASFARQTWISEVFISVEGPYFILGAIIGLSVHRKVGRSQLGMLLLLTIPLLSRNLYELLIHYPARNAIADIVYILGSIILIFVAVKVPQPRSSLLTTALPVLGQASYPLYLLGGAFGMMLVRLPQIEGFNSVWTQFLPYLIISVIAVFFVKLIEPRFFPAFFSQTTSKAKVS